MSKPCYVCDNDGCAEEISYPPDMLRVYKGRPYCEYCWEDMPPVFAPDIDDGEPLMWRDLEPFVPEHDKRIAEQQAEIEALREDIRCLTKADIVRVPTKDAQQAEIEALKAKIDRLTSRGIEDMKARIAELEEGIRTHHTEIRKTRSDGGPDQRLWALLPGGDHGVVDRLG